MAHSFIIYGEKGLGKKMMARYLAMMLVCESEDKPCGKCRACKNASGNIHPDIIYAEHSGKTNIFSVETIRNICVDAYIKPNESQAKVFVFTDADNITVQAQNSLLKLIEEPPPYAYFIFTSLSKSVFLDTVISRSISLSVSETDRDTAYQALTDIGFTDEQAYESIKIFGGNIGMCIEYTNSDELKNTVRLTKTVTDCIINRDEYGLLYALTEASSDKNLLRDVLTMLDKVIRDSLAVRYSSESVTGCYSEGSAKLSDTTTIKSCTNLHRAVTEAYMMIGRNVNTKLIVSSLCGEIASYR